MIRFSEIERKKMKRLPLVALIPSVCATCGPLVLATAGFSPLVSLAMLALFAFRPE